MSSTPPGHVPAARLSQLLYRSLAAPPLSLPKLQQLMHSARQRNEVEALTGLLVYDQGRFVQWLEGPEEGLERVWAAIRRDPRHRAVECLHRAWGDARVFPGWRMQLGLAHTAELEQAVNIPGAVLHELRELGRADADTGADASEMLRGLALWRELPEAADLALLLARADEATCQALGQRIARLQPAWSTLGMHLLGPAARALAKAWNDDRLESSELIIAQTRLQVMLRGLGDAASFPRPLADAGQALVATVPGERDITGLTFAGIALDAAGFEVQCAFPASTAELERLLRQQSFSVLHLAASDAFARTEALGAWANTVLAARRASANPRLQVLLSGRAFIEQPGLAVLLGADGDGLAQGSSTQDLARMLRWAHTRAASPAAMAAQATLLDVCLHIRSQHFGDAGT